MNEQRREIKTVSSHSKRLDVIGIWRTIQGEGPLAGTPAVFLRLAGCNLACPSCDTDYTTGRKEMPFDDILNDIDKAWDLSVYPSSRRLIVITGGEPFRQEELINFLAYIRYGRYVVQIETNGLWTPTPLEMYALKHIIKAGDKYGMNLVSIVCSPKMPQLDTGVEDMLRTGEQHAFKYILHHEYVDEVDGLPTQGLGYEQKPYRPRIGYGGNLEVGPNRIYVQPEWNEDKGVYERNVKAAIKSCTLYNYRLSLQLHKMIGVD